MFRIFRKGLGFIIPVIIITLLLPACKTSNGGDNANGADKAATKLMWYVPGVKQADQDVVLAAINQKLKEKMNVELVLNVIDTGSFDERMNMVIASNENFDMCFTSGWLNKYNINIMKGAFVDLTLLIDKYAPMTKKSMPDYVFTNATKNGKLYAIPNSQLFYNSWGMVIQKDIAQKYNLDVNSIPADNRLETIRALEPFLEKVKEGEKDLFPCRAYIPSTISGQYEPLYGGGLLAIKKGEIPMKVYTFEEVPDYNETEKMFADWYNKGYFRKDVATIMNDTVDYNNMMYAVMPQVLKPGGLEEFEQKNNKECIAISLFPPYVDGGAGTSTMTAVSKNSKSPEKAVSLIELFNTDKELYNMLCYGLEGKHYTRTDSNYIEPVKDSKYNPGMSWAYGNQFNAYLVKGQPLDAYEKTKRINFEAERSSLIGFNLNNEDIKVEVSQLLALEKEYKYIWVYPDYEQRYKMRLEKKEKAGIEKIRQELQKQLDVWNAEKAH